MEYYAVHTAVSLHARPHIIAMYSERSVEAIVLQ